jgi:hypothetical protein
VLSQKRPHYNAYGYHGRYCNTRTTGTYVHVYRYVPWYSVPLVRTYVPMVPYGTYHTMVWYQWYVPAVRTYMMPSMLTTHHSFTADLALHTQALTCMWNSNQQHTQILAAQVLSSSCRHSGCVLQSLPIHGRAMADGQYVQLLRLRLGVPCVAQWRCNCASHGGPHHSAYVESAVERAAEANQDDHQQQTASFATDPCHGL